MSTTALVVIHSSSSFRNILVLTSRIVHGVPAEWHRIGRRGEPVIRIACRFLPADSVCGALVLWFDHPLTPITKFRYLSRRFGLAESVFWTSLY